MSITGGKLNLVLSGGGIKGVAFIGAYEEIEKKYRQIGNIAGVSAGAIVGSLIGAGYTAREMTKILKEFNFSSFMNRNNNYLSISIAEKVRMLANEKRILSNYDMEMLLYKEDYPELQAIRKNRDEFRGGRGKLLANLVAFSKENAFVDGELFEKWIAQVLANKGIHSFSDFKDGSPDKVNPRGYKVRMTAVDANLGKVLVLPDDLIQYNIDPDSFSVARAVRMSSTVPFVFEPVVLMKKENNHSKQHYIIDGGVLDNFPVWLIDSTEPGNNIIGLRLVGKEPKELQSAENILKKLLVSSHDTGVPQNAYNIDNIGQIDTGNISFLDFDLNPEQMQFLYNQGKISAQKLLANMQKRNRGMGSGKRHRINL